MSSQISLEEMLEAREKRVKRQRELLDRYHMPLVSFTMNIAGPVKNSPLIRRGFRLGDRMLREQLTRVRAECVHSEITEEHSGCTGFYVVNVPAQTLKQLCCELEDHTAAGRLFDMDVLTPEGEKLDRPTSRQCLICGGPAKDCARNRTHSVEELQRRTREILQSALSGQDIETAADFAVRALLYEVCTTPKPGLVDRVSNGSHKDMDIYTFMDSASGLWPYFAQCVRVGQQTAVYSPEKTFAAVRWDGKAAENQMLRVTGGVNTHKGAIFSLGLLCAALGRLNHADWTSPKRILTEVSAMTQGLTRRELESMKDAYQSTGSADEPGPAVPTTDHTARERFSHTAGERFSHTAGEWFYLDRGITGVRGQAEAGFPVVLEYGLPTLERGLSAGKSKDEAGAAAMLTMLAHTVDTNMIARGGYDVQQEISRHVRGLLDRMPYPDTHTLEELDRMFTRRNLSPGGSADLLALCWFLHFLRTEEESANGRVIPQEEES